MSTAKAMMETSSKAVRSNKAYCQVCPTWEIKIPERCSNTIAKKGKTLYFCTKRCKERFLKAPEKFL